MKVGNLLALTRVPSGAERFDTLIQTTTFRLERIVSRGSAGAAHEWVDQDRDEWVVVITGNAELLFEGSPRPMPLAPGDWVHIPAHVRHRVVRTDPERETVWLALHYQA